MKKLVRLKKDRKIAGVCSGIAKYLDIDPTIIRLAFLFLALPGGAPGIIPYVIFWLIMPEE